MTITTATTTAAGRPCAGRRPRVGSIGRGVESLRAAWRMARRHRFAQCAGLAGLGLADVAAWMLPRAGLAAFAVTAVTAAGCVYLVYVTAVAVRAVLA